MEKELPMYYKVGLNDSEVQERIAKGQVNGVSKPVSKSYGQIIKDNGPSVAWSCRSSRGSGFICVLCIIGR